jgi:hypothetical protein
MLHHFINLLWRSFVAIPTALGSSWTGLVFPVIVVLIGEGLGIWLFGITAMRDNFKRVTGVGFAALGVGYTLLFFWCFIKTTFDDHIDLAGRSTRLAAQLSTADSSKREAVGLCTNLLDVANESLRGKAELVDSLQNTLTGEQAPQLQQQANIASCITNLAKMNPIIRLRISVIMDPFATMDVQGRIDPNQTLVKKQITELFIITNVEQQNFRGVLTCANPFTILAGPFIQSESRLITNGTPPPVPKGDRSYEIRVEQSNTVWNSSHPAYLRAVSEMPNPGGCTFTQTE